MNNYIEEYQNKYNLNQDFVKKYEVSLKRYAESKKLCENCEGLFTCRQKSVGEYIDIVLEDNVLLENIEYCKYQKEVKIIENLDKAYAYSDIPKNLLSLSLNNIEILDDNIKALASKCLNIYNQKTNKGLYVFGDLGVGKTYMMIALANSLVKKGKKVSFIKITNFINDMRKIVGLDDGSYEQIINTLKNSEYLFIDDIGSESVTTFSRDDILFNILDYRMENKLITLFTSNYDKKSLEEYYASDKSGKVSSLHARRLLERIDILSEDFVLVGQNKRRIHD